MNNLVNIITLLILVIFVSGCSTKYIQDPTLINSLQGTDVSDHFIFIDNDGYMKDVNDKKIPEYKIKIDDIFSKFSHLKQNNPDLSMTIYIHGGLNTFSSTVARVKNTYKKILSKKQYPIFISWKSGPFTNYLDHLFMIRQGERSALKGLPSFPFIFAEDALRSVARILPSSWNIVAGQNNLSIKYVNNVEEAAEKSESRIEKHTNFNVHKNMKYSSGHGFLDFVTIWNPVKFVTAPLADGFGKGAWGSMLRRTDLVLNSQKAFEGGSREDSQTAAHYFFYLLDKNHNNTRKTLIGHSMGTIIANNVLSRFPNINFNEVIYMAAACKIKDLEKSVVPWLRADKNRNFYNLTLNPYRDINENGYFDFVPRGSLLIWLDEFLADVDSFEDRTAGYWFNIMRTAEVVFPPNIRNQVHLTRYGIKNISPQNHGDFDDFNFWDETFWINADKGVYPIIKNWPYENNK
ncbi:MAG: hypothetical protein COC04_00550 [Gammaproteobacteria bacterium]|nr:MAG: hypothetical protein COC04_00550 [Gammaproteobacteria bacterium]